MKFMVTRNAGVVVKILWMKLQFFDLMKQGEFLARPVMLFISLTALYASTKVLDQQYVGHHISITVNLILNCTCRIAKHFFDVNVNISLKNLRFVLVDALSNNENLASDEVGDLLLRKETFWKPLPPPPSPPPFPPKFPKKRRGSEFIHSKGRVGKIGGLFIKKGVITNFSLPFYVSFCMCSLSFAHLHHFSQYSLCFNGRKAYSC